jgi:hypothetical protein
MTRSKIDVLLRILGSLLVVIAYGVIVHIDVTVGVGLSLTGDLLALPFFIRTRAWDVVAMIGFLSIVSVSKLSQGLFT